MDRHLKTNSRLARVTLFVATFSIALFVFGLVVHVFVTTISVVSGLSGSYLHLSFPAAAAIALIWLLVFSKCDLTYRAVCAGGATLASRYGACVANASNNEQERQLLDLCEELASASNSKQPEIYILPDKSNVNAFILGYEKSDPVIVFTKGALDTLDTEQLKAVVAYAIAFITKGDLTFDMRLMIAASGLMVFDEIGQGFISNTKNDQVTLYSILGHILCMLGYPGVVAAKLVTASFAYQRVYSTDKKAIELTGDSYALASALDVFFERDDVSELPDAVAGKIAHLSFQNDQANDWFSRNLWLRKYCATHPEVLDRINAFEPQFHVKKLKAILPKYADADNVCEFVALPVNTTDRTKSMSAEAGNVGNADNIASTDEISDRIGLLLSTESLCLAGLFALFVNDFKGGEKAGYQDAVGENFNTKFQSRLKQVLKLIPDELVVDQIGLINHVTLVLKQKMSEDMRLKITLKLEHLLSSNKQYNLLDYARVQLIRRKLGVEFPVILTLANSGQAQASGCKVKKPDAMGREFSLLLSLLAEAGGLASTEMDEKYKTVLKRYTQQEIFRRTSSEDGIDEEMEIAFQSLFVQPQQVRNDFVQHCAELLRRDGALSLSNRTLLDLFAASLECENVVESRLAA